MVSVHRLTQMNANSSISHINLHADVPTTPAWQPTADHADLTPAQFRHDQAAFQRYSHYAPAYQSIDLGCLRCESPT